jgi:hypothetical protein
MTLRRASNLAALTAVGLLITCLLCASSFAKGPLPDAPSASSTSAAVSPAPVIAAPNTRIETTHRFWDKQNTVFFAAGAALNTADFFVTRSNLRSGGRELNPVVRVFGTSTPALAMNFVGETAGVMGISYFFHRTGHHRLERIVSFVNIGGSAGAVGYGLTHR